MDTRELFKALDKIVGNLTFHLQKEVKMKNNSGTMFITNSFSDCIIKWYSITSYISEF